MTYHPSDTASRDLWIKNGIDPSHLIPLEGNFWEIGEGPCGPDTEIFFDRGEKYDPEGLGKKLLENDMENDRFIEIWNIVFSQYNAEEGERWASIQAITQPLWPCLTQTPERLFAIANASCPCGRGNWACARAMRCSTIPPPCRKCWQNWAKR